MIPRLKAHSAIPKLHSSTPDGHNAGCRFALIRAWTC